MRGLVLFMLCSLPVLVAAKTATALRVEQAPTLDGVLDESAWSAAVPLTDFIQHDPVEGGDPSEPTTVKVLFDADNLYVGAEMHYADPAMIVRNVMVRQTRLFGEDRLHLVIDPFGDRRNGYYFEVNANGQRAEALLENNNNLIADWDGIWYAATRLHEGGWTVELRIPFKSLSFDPSLSEWGFNVYRSINARREFNSWATPRRQDFPYPPAQAGTLKGLGGLRQGLGLDVMTSLSVRQVDRRGEPRDVDFEPSVDIFYKLNNATTAALTWNTDFSATEVDDRQLNLSRFSLFFPEKRRFFLQDAGIFEFGGLYENGRPFFSRRIGLSPEGGPIPLVGGGKLTGRAGDVGFGLLGIRQDADGGRPAANLFVGRASLNFARESSAGLIVTDGDPSGETDNRVVGADLRLRRGDLFGDQTIQTTAWAQRTEGAGIGPESEAFGAQLLLPNDRWFVDASAREIGADFDPALGFVNRAGIREYEFFFRFRSRPEGGRWLAHNHWIYGIYTADTDNRLESARVELTPWAPFSRAADFYWPRFEHSREVLGQPFALFGRIDVPAGDYAFSFASMRLESSEARRLRVFATVGAGEFFDGDRRLVSVDATWRASRRMTLDLDLEWNAVELPRGRYIARLASLRGSYALTPDLALIGLAQFDNVSDELGLDLRLAWQPPGGRELFLVYNRGARRDGESFTTERRDAILKLSWTWRY